MDLTVGQEFDEYVITEVLGAGGFGKVYKANHKSITVPTQSGSQPLVRAIKQLTLSQPQAIERFKREAGVLIQLSQIAGSNVTAVYDLKQVKGQLYLIMEYVPGGTLGFAAASRQLEEPTLIKIAIEVCKGLEIMHTNKPTVIHRDIKPENIKVEFIGANIKVKILDFGIAAVLMGMPVNEVVGTYPFSGPAQMKGEFATMKMDQHSLGTTLFFCMMDAQLPEAQRYAPFPFEQWSSDKERATVLARYPQGYRKVVADAVPPIPDVWNAEAIFAQRLAATKYTPQFQAIVARMAALNEDKKFDSITDVRKALESLMGLNIVPPNVGSAAAQLSPAQTGQGAPNQSASFSKTTGGAPPPPPPVVNSGASLPIGRPPKNT